MLILNYKNAQYFEVVNNMNKKMFPDSLFLLNSFVKGRFSY